jgi:hypothetical protein
MRKIPTATFDAVRTPSLVRDMGKAMQCSLFPGRVDWLRQSPGSRRSLGGGIRTCNWRRWNKRSIIFTIIVNYNIRTIYWVNWLDLIAKWMDTRISTCHWLPGTGLATLTITAVAAGAKVTD